MALNPYIAEALRRRQGGFLGYTRAQVEAGAGLQPGMVPGVTSGVTPGVTGVGRTNIDGGGQAGYTITHRYASDGANSAEAFSQLATFGGGGSGTEADPYVFRNALPYNFTNANGDTQAAFYWNHDAATYPSESYWIKWENVHFGTDYASNKAGDLYINAPTGGGAIVDHCTFNGWNAVDTTPAVLGAVVAVRGTTRLVASKCSRYSNAHFIVKNGANAKVEVIDSLFDAAGNPWIYGGGLVRNAVTGGSILIRTTTCDFQHLQQIVSVGKDVAVTLDRVKFNEPNNASVGAFISTHTAVMTERWSLGLTMTNCDVRGGGALSMLGFSDLANAQKVSNTLIEHCVITKTGTGTGFMVGFGNTTGAFGDSDNNRVRFCKFSRPQTPAVSGAEVIYLARNSNSLIEACWVDGCGEDAYEYHQPYGNCIVRFCLGTNVNGNIADFYGAFGAAQASAAWDLANYGNIGGNQAHHLWGDCRGDALIIDCVHGVIYDHINVINNVGTPFPANYPAANVRLHWRSSSGIPSLNGVVGGKNLAAPAISFASKPAELTYETGSNTYAQSAPAIAASTLVWQEWNGSDFDARGCQHGIVDNMA